MEIGTIGLIVGVVFLLIILRFVGKILKNLVLLVLFVIGSTFAVWYFVPEDKLKEVVGTELYDKVANVFIPWVEKLADDTIEAGKEKLEEIGKEVVLEEGDSTLKQ